MAAKVQGCNLYSIVFKRNRRGPLRDKHSRCPWVLSNLFTNECRLHRERTDRESLQTTKPKNFSKWRASQKKKSLSLNQFINEAHVYTASITLSRGTFQDPSSRWNSRGLTPTGLTGPARNTHSWQVLPNRLAESGIWDLCLAIIVKENQQTEISQGRWIYLLARTEMRKKFLVSSLLFC